MAVHVCIGDAKTSLVAGLCGDDDLTLYIVCSFARASSQTLVVLLNGGRSSERYVVVGSLLLLETIKSTS